jgi:hypothetical protein
MMSLMLFSSKDNHEHFGYTRNSFKRYSLHINIFHVLDMFGRIKDPTD